MDFFGKAMRRLESENILGTIEEMKEVKRQAMQVFRYTEGQGPKTENLKSAILLKKMIILDEILVESFDGIKIVPFSLLDERKKQCISSLVEDEIISMQRFHDSQSISTFAFNKAERD